MNSYEKEFSFGNKGITRQREKPKLTLNVGIIARGKSDPSGLPFCAVKQFSDDFLSADGFPYKIQYVHQC